MKTSNKVQGEKGSMDQKTAVSILMESPMYFRQTPPGRKILVQELINDYNRFVCEVRA